MDVPLRAACRSARFRFHFEGGPIDDVLTALAAYQNDDGGFGHGLEADSWDPASSPLQTQTAVELLCEAGMTDRQHPVVQGIIRYLTSGASFDGRRWYTALASGNDHPHAPWWTAQEDTCWADNPTAELAGFLLAFADKGSAAWALGLDVARKAVLSLVLSTREADMHELRCFIRLYEMAERVQADIGLDTLRKALTARIAQAVTRDPAQWETSYCCRPSQLITGGTSAFLPGLEQLCREECAFLRRTQQEDGTWPVAWQWTGYPDAWAVARTRWQGHCIVTNLLHLRSFGGEG